MRGPKRGFIWSSLLKMTVQHQFSHHPMPNFASSQPPKSLCYFKEDADGKPRFLGRLSVKWSNCCFHANACPSMSCKHLKEIGIFCVLSDITQYIIRLKFVNCFIFLFIFLHKDILKERQLTMNKA